MKVAQTNSSLTEHPLHRQLGLRDLVLTQILCVVGSSWVGVAAGLGRAQTITWIAAMLVFYLPMAASVIGLNREMPLEGGLYVWAHKAFGDLGGFLTAWNIWVYGIAISAAILYAIPTELSYLIGPSAAWLPENHAAAFAIVAAITLAVSAALFGQMIFGALVGLEYIAILAGESKDAARSIGKSVILASPVICAMFIFGTSSVLTFSHDRIDYIAPIPQTFRFALGNSGVGNYFAVMAILLVQIRLIAATSLIFTG